MILSTNTGIVQFVFDAVVQDWQHLGPGGGLAVGGHAAEWSYFTRVSFPVLGFRRITMLSMPVINRGDNVLSA